MFGNAQQADHPGQGEALAHQGHQDHREGDQQQRAAVGKGRITGHHGNGQRRRQRHHAPYASEGDDKRVLPGRRGIAPCQARQSRARQVGCEKDPDKTHHNDGGAYRSTGQRQMAPFGQVQRVGDDAGLQPGHQEDQALDQIDHQVPDKESLQPGGGRDVARAVPADIKAGNHGRQHARAAQAFRHPEGGEGREQREHHLHPGFTGPAAQRQYAPADRQAPDDLSRHDQEEFAGGGRQRKGAALRHRFNREAEQDQGGRIVHQPFAFQDGEHALGQGEAPRDRHRRHSIGRRHDRPQHKARRQRQSQQVMRHARHRDGGEDHQPHRQEKDGAQVGLEAAPAHIHPGAIQQRRQQQAQHQIGAQFDAGHPGQKTNRQPQQHQENGIGNMRTPCPKGGEGRHRDQAEGEGQNGLEHGASVRRRQGARNRAGRRAHPPQVAGARRACLRHSSRCEEWRTR